MGLLIFYASGAILISFLCSILEAVLLSIPPTFVTLKQKEGKAYAYALSNLKKDIDRPLIAILTLNTVAHTVGAILVGVQAEKVFGDGNNAVFAVSSIMTVLVLVVSEIIPKTIGARFWKQLAGFSTRSLQIIIFPMQWTGTLWLLRQTTKAIGGKHPHGSLLSREELTVMTDIAKEEGVVEESESKVIKNLLKFREITLKDIMTPRTVLKTASKDTTVEEFLEENPELRFSRIPIYEDNPDMVTGFVLKDQVLEEMVKGNGSMPLNQLKRNILIAPRDMPIPKMFDLFITQKEHIALVVDEYGSVSGLVTTEDIIETLLGLEIMDESDNVDDLQVLARKNWERRARRLGIIEKKEEE